MDVLQHYYSLSSELSSLKDRVRNLIEDANWLTDGEWKESVLRTSLRRHMPDTVEVGRGFVITPGRCSTQIDILIYDKSFPVLHKDGNLIFTSPDAVKGIIEVKSVARSNNITDAIRKLSDNSKLIRSYSVQLTGKLSNDLFVGLFSFECDENLPQRGLLQRLKNSARGDHQRVVNHLCLGSSRFIRYWQTSPDGIKDDYRSWRSYDIKN